MNAADVYNMLGDKSLRSLKLSINRMGKDIEINITPEDVD